MTQMVGVRAYLRLEGSGCDGDSPTSIPRSPPPQSQQSQQALSDGCSEQHCSWVVDTEIALRLPFPVTSDL